MAARAKGSSGGGATAEAAARLRGCGCMATVLAAFAVRNATSSAVVIYIKTHRCY